MTQSYPDRPGFKTTGPSEEAADAIAPRALRIRDSVLEVIAAPLGLSILTVRPRVSELHRMGEIRRASDRRCNASGMTASTWRVAPPLPNDVNSSPKGQP